MTTLERVSHWKQAGIITDSQYAAISSLVRKERFSIFLELNALLYLGVASLAAGLGWTFKTYFTNLGDAFILVMFSAMLLASLYYCFSRGAPYSSAQAESPNLFFDYVLYFGCLVFAAELGYIEFRFELARDAWDAYLLLSAGAFFFLAYRFDNRFVLSLALSSLAGWFGLRLSKNPDWDSLGLPGLIYGAVVAFAGVDLWRRGIKKHFLETYLHVATNVLLLAALSFRDSDKVAYFALLCVLSGTAIVLGVRYKRFAFVAYGIVYGYIGVSWEVLSSMHGPTAVLGYIVVTGTMVILTMIALARQFGRDE